MLERYSTRNIWKSFHRHNINTHIKQDPSHSRIWDWTQNLWTIFPCRPTLPHLGVYRIRIFRILPEPDLSLSKVFHIHSRCKMMEKNKKEKQFTIFKCKVQNLFYHFWRFFQLKLRTETIVHISASSFQIEQRNYNQFCWVLKVWYKLPQILLFTWVTPTMFKTLSFSIFN